VSERAAYAGGTESLHGSRSGASRRSSATSRPRRRRRARSRFAGVLRLGVFLLLIFFAVWAGVRVAHAGADGAIYLGRPYAVHNGETLWGIAAREYGNDVDLRRAVYAIRSVNDLSGSALQPGQRLTLPYLAE